MVTVLSVPAGASLTAVTLMVNVLAGAQVDATVGGTAGTLEGEARVAAAVGVCGRCEHQAVGDVGDRDVVTGADRMPSKVRLPAPGAW